MKYEGKVYAKINGRYIECTQNITDLEKQIEYLKNKIYEFENIKCMYCESDIKKNEAIILCNECAK